MIFVKIELIFFSLFFMACQSSTPPTQPVSKEAQPVAVSESKTDSFSLKYVLDKPDQTWEMPDELVELSGIAIAGDDKLACIQDENGLLFIYDLKEDKILSQSRFRKDGDFEDVSIVKDKIYILKSNGNIYELENNPGGTEMPSEKYESHLKKVNDSEGLCYDEDNNRLLIACKGIAADGEEYLDKRGIYAFDLNTKKVSAKPVFLIKLREIQDWLKMNPTARHYNKLAEFFMPEKGNIVFQPSALAIHPKTKNIYVLSSVGKLLLILNPEGKMIHLEKLEKEIHKQPEGIAFYPNGDLLIASEGKKAIAKVHLFKYK